VNQKAKIVVASRSFSQMPELRERLKSEFAHVRFNETGKSLAGGELVHFLKGADAAVIALEKVDDELLSQLPQLRMISKYGVGLNNLDQDAMKRRNVDLGWTGGVNRRSVTELTLSFMLGLSRHVWQSAQWLRAGTWKTSGGTQISGKKIGIIGFGHIGTDLAPILKAFGCQLLVHDILDKSVDCGNVGARQVPLDELLQHSDIVTLHVPYEPSTHHLIGAPQLARMKKGAILINTSRGGIVDESALLAALKSGALAASGADVFVQEPNTESELLKLDNFWGTPHIGGSSREAILAMGNSAIDHLVQYFSSRSA
jgi:phosphoglycerate dehydrogenase-like enzyme